MMSVPVTETSPWFARRGFCFQLEPEVEDGVFVLQVHYQNCFAHKASADVQLEQVDGPLADVLHLECEGGATGTTRWLWPVPARLQGTRVEFRVSADVNYGGDPGPVVSDRPAVAVPNRPTTTMRFFRTLRSTFVSPSSFGPLFAVDFPQSIAEQVQGHSGTEPLAHPVVQYTLLAILVGLFVVGLIIVLMNL
jgi:hypothetical protein